MYCDEPSPFEILNIVVHELSNVGKKCTYRTKMGHLKFPLSRLNSTYLRFFFSPCRVSYVECGAWFPRISWKICLIQMTQPTMILATIAM